MSHGGLEMMCGRMAMGPIGPEPGAGTASSPVVVPMACLPAAAPSGRSALLSVVRATFI